MPCLDPYADERSSERLQDELARSREQVDILSAFLCAALRRLIHLDGPCALERLDYIEAGVTQKSLEKWWKKHQALDAKRRKAELARRIRQEQRRAEHAEHQRLIEEAVVSLTPQQLATVVGDSPAAKKLRSKHSRKDV